MQRDDPSGARPGGPAPAGSRGEGAAPGTDGDAVLAALAHRLRARSERQQLLTERLRSGELRPGALADLAELAAAARRGVRDGDHILVMSGAPPAARGGGAVPLGQALSTAVAASEAASRTVVPPTPSVSLDGTAEPVFGQILAELLAHVVTTTGPGERLELHVRWAPDGGVVLELLCAQPAQGRAPVEDLDRMLAAGRPAGAVAPHEIGLYVAARLCRVIGARLGTRSPAGTQAEPGLSPVAVLQLPPSLLVGGRGGQDPARPDGGAAVDPGRGPDAPAEPVTASVPSAEPPAPPWPPIPSGAEAGTGPPLAAQTPGQLPSGTGRFAAGGRPAPPVGRHPGPNVDGSPLSTRAPHNPPPGAPAGPGAPFRGRSPSAPVPFPQAGPGPVVPPPFEQPSAGAPPVTDALQVPGSTPPMELFGPFDSEVPVPTDDMEGTPIFAAVASAWFRDPETTATSPTAALPTGPNGVRTGPPVNWSTVGDAEFEAARRRANRVVESPTTAQGLPQRRPGQQMVPPSRRDVDAARHAGSMERQPDRVRNRLASYQRGLREGRHRAAEEHQGGSTSNGSPPNGAGRVPWPVAQPMAPTGDGRPGGHGPGENGTNGVDPFGENGRNVG